MCVTVSARRKKSQKKLEWSYALVFFGITLHSSFFGIFCVQKNFLPDFPVRHWIWDCGYEQNRESAQY